MALDAILSARYGCWRTAGRCLPAHAGRAGIRL